MYKRIITYFLAFSIVITSVMVPVRADVGQDDPGDLIPEYNTPLIGGNSGGPMAPLPVGTGFFKSIDWEQLIATASSISIIDGIGDYIKDLVAEYFCPRSITPFDAFHQWYNPSEHPEHKVCFKCGKVETEIDVTWKDLWDDFVGSLPYSEVTNDGLFTVQPSGWSFDWSGFDQVYLSDSAVIPIDKGFEVDGKLLAACQQGHYAKVVSSAFTLPVGLFSLNMLSYSGSNHDYDSLYGSRWSVLIEGSNDGETWSRIQEACYDPGGFGQPTRHESIEFSTVDHPYAYYRVYEQLHTGFVSGSLKAGTDVKASRTVSIDCLALLESVPEQSADSRPSGIMDAIQEYNITHNYGDTNVINYYIGSFDEDDNLTGYYPMDIYDEQTLVFTEPVTGAQYLTIGWRYDYAARRYTLDLEPGTFALGDYDILQICLTYGDEAVTIQYYNELGQLVETDEFQYVMVAKEQCTLNGHDYSYQTIKEPSCTGTGERLCTCSVCGKETVQEISMLEHTGVYSVFQEATCTASGVGLMTCSRCGTQVSEDIPALGHDWLPVEDVETMYALPDGTSCPACSGVDFTAELDRINEVYSCSCASCGQIWTADAHVQHGYTKYECSRCGKVKTESKSQEDGLFASVGNLIADGIIWCTEKLTQLVDSLTGIVDTFTGYLDTLASTGGAFPSFLALLFSALPEELTSLIWLSLVGLVALLVWKKWLS